ncbi:DUF7662 domain-containing protein [Sphingomonas sp.]|uniref:DUF7662 domain-containing protein n=1 Tax=Sphingomonas sp. TaxID=28214 RepID=UPI002DBD706E|nr:hypothetical protein [Sphingomonas sp.]HEU4968987.1 hypothetical protein [Sphingomonas sp.]
MKSKYSPLREHLASKPRGEFQLSFAEIERVLGFKLPASANRPQWWANVTGGGHPHSRSWQDAGFDAFLVEGFRRVRFRSK